MLLGQVLLHQGAVLIWKSSQHGLDNDSEGHPPSSVLDPKTRTKENKLVHVKREETKKCILHPKVAERYVADKGDTRAPKP